MAAALRLCARASAMISRYGSQALALGLAPTVADARRWWTQPSLQRRCHYQDRLFW